MPRAKKTRDEPPPGEPSAETAAERPAPESAGDSAAEERPSQLEQIRAAISEPVGADEPPELPAPEELAELPAPAEESAPETEPGAAAVAVAAPPTSPWVPPPTEPPPSARPAEVAAARSGRPSSSLALGIVLVVIGVFFLIVRLANIDLSTYGWPLYVIIPGLTLLVIGFVSLGTGAVIPGGIVTVTGLVLAYQNSTGDWASWAYAWALVVPFGVGLGIFLQGLRDRDSKQIRQGRSAMFWGLLLFMIGFVLFESIFNISNMDYGVVGRAALPALLIVIGVTLLARSVQRGRSA